MTFPLIEKIQQDIPRLGHRFGAIHDFIRATAPDVDRPDRTSFLRRHEHGPEVEGLRPFLGFEPTTLISLIQRDEAGFSNHSRD